MLRVIFGLFGVIGALTVSVAAVIGALAIYNNVSVQPTPTSIPPIPTQVVVIVTSTPQPTKKIRPAQQVKVLAATAAPLPTLVPVRTKVSFTTTEGEVNGTYSCYQDRVNELTRYENDIKIKTEIAKSCQVFEQVQQSNCASKCSVEGGTSEIVSCVDACYANSECLPKFKKVGDLRMEYMAKLREICP